MGGFFDGGASPKTPKPNRKANTSGVNEQAPGGFFQGGADPQASKNAASSATDSKFWAEQSKGWAVGIDEESLTSWSRTNNSKAYAEEAAFDAQSASTDAGTASMAATNAATSATNAAIDRGRAEQAADRSKSWAVGPNGADENGTDTNNARWWAMQAEDHHGNSEQWARDAQGWAVGDTDDPLGGWSATNNAEYYSGQAKSSETAAASSASDAEDYRNAALVARDAAQDAEQEAQDALDSALAAMKAADSDRVITENAAQAAEDDALVAKSWAVGPSNTGQFGSDTNNAHYWAEESKKYYEMAVAEHELHTAQFDFTIANDNSFDTDDFTYTNNVITITDSDLFVEDPVVSYNGVVLSEGEHYTVSNEGTVITFETKVGLTDGDNITVTGANEADSDAGVNYDLIKATLIAGTDVTLDTDDADLSITINSSATGVDYDALKDIITAGENVTIDTDDTNETLTINNTASGGGGTSYAMAETVEIHYTGATWANGVGISNTDTTNASGWIDWTGFTTQAPTGWTAKDTENDEGGFGVDSIVFTNGTSDDVTVHRIDLITEGYEGNNMSSGYSIRIYNNGSSIIGNYTIQGSTDTPGIFHTVMDSDWNSDFPDAGLTIAAGNKMSFSLSNVGIQLKVLHLGLSFQSDKTPFDFAGTGGTRNVTATRFTKLPVAFTHDLYWNGISVTGDTDQADYTWTSRR